MSTHGQPPRPMRLLRTEDLLRPLDPPEPRPQRMAQRGIVFFIWMCSTMPLTIVAALTAPNPPFAWALLTVSTITSAWIITQYLLGDGDG